MFELKPYNARSIRAALKQLENYKAGLYYIDGRYYNSLTCSYLDSMDIENVFNNSNVIGGLNLNSICIDNPIDNDSYYIYKF